MARAPKDRFNQVAALPFRHRNGTLEVLLVTSRETKRWLIPKGWPIKGKKAHKAAAQEALEEAGVKGEVHQNAIGHYDYWKRRAEHFDLCRVQVYPLEVSKQLKKWPEKGERDFRWFEIEEAAQQVEEPALAAVILALREHVKPRPAEVLPALTG